MGARETRRTLRELHGPDVEIIEMVAEGGPYEETIDEPVRRRRIDRRYRMAPRPEPFLTGQPLYVRAAAWFGSAVALTAVLMAGLSITALGAVLLWTFRLWR